MKKKIGKIVLCLAVFLILAWVLWGNLTVGLTEITITEKNLPVSFDGLRIAHVSDLHNSHLWKQTIKQLQKAQPDIICITGDVVDSNRTDVDTALAFATEAMKIAPCYYIIGNHELRLDAATYDALLEGLKKIGVIVLCDEAIAVERGDEAILIVGAYWNSASYMGDQFDYDGYRLMLVHDPKNFESFASGNYDLVLSGHAHGGQFRIPLLGGLLAPSQGWFPTYDAGLFSSGVTDMYISRGIGNSSFPLRLNNRPEVVVITLKA